MFRALILLSLCGLAVAAPCTGWHLRMRDAGGDGWEGARITLFDCATKALVYNETLRTGSQGEVCLSHLNDSDGFSIHVTSGWFPLEISWVLGFDTVTNLTGGAPFFGDINCSSTCPSEHDLTLVLSAPPHASWENNFLSISYCTESGNFLILSNVTLTGNSMGLVDICLPLEEGFGYLVSVGGGRYPNGVQWSLLNQTGGHLMQGRAPFLGYEGCPISPCGSEWRLTLKDSFGDGWTDNTMNVYDCNHEPLAVGLTLDYGAMAQASVCLPPLRGTGYIIDVGGGEFRREVSWVIHDSEGVQILTGGAPYFGSFNCSRTPCNLNSWRVVLRSNSPDGWGGSEMTITACNGTVLASHITLNSAFGSEQLCLPTLTGYILTVTDGSNPSAVDWSIVSGDGRTLLEGGAPYNFRVGTCPPEPCKHNDLDLHIDNAFGQSLYWSISNCNHTNIIPDLHISPGFNSSIDLCVPNVDAYYLVAAGGETGDGDQWKLTDTSGVIQLQGNTPYFGNHGCPETPCSENLFKLIMIDTYADTWNGITLTILDCNNTVLRSNIQPDDDRHVQGMSLCLPPSPGYRVQVTTGTWKAEVRWLLLNSEGVEVLSGGSPFAGSFNCPAVRCSGNDWDLHLSDTYGDGWTSNILKMTSCTGETVVEDITMHTGFNETADLCIPKHSGYIVMVGRGAWQEEVAWNVKNEKGKEVLSGSAPYYGSVGCDGCHEFTVGPSNQFSKLVQLPAVPMKCSHVNTSEHHTLSVVGNILNVSSSRPWSQNLKIKCCTVACDGYKLSLVMTDTYGDGWNGNLLTLRSCDRVPYLTNITLLDGHIGGVEFCLVSNPRVKIHVGHGRYRSEVGWYLLGEDRRILTSGGADRVSHDFNCPKEVLITMEPTERIIPMQVADYGLHVRDLFGVSNIGFAGQGCAPSSIHVPSPSVALVQRGRCSFMNHTLKAQSLGVTAVVIVNDDNQLVEMAADPSGPVPEIATVLVPKSQFGFLNATKHVFMGMKECTTLVFGSSVNNTESIQTYYDNLVCSNLRLNPDFRSASDTFDVTVVHNSLGAKVTVKRTDKQTGWGMNLQILCCTEAILFSPSVTPSPGYIDKEHKKHGTSAGVVAGAVFGCLFVAAGAVFAYWRIRGSGSSRVPRMNIKPPIQEPLMTPHA